MTNLAAIGSSIAAQAVCSEESQTASSGKPAARQASRPPRNALAAVIPTSLSNRAARALLPSFVQVQ